jgi:hypothetical protein
LVQVIVLKCVRQQSILQDHRSHAKGSRAVLFLRVRRGLGVRDDKAGCSIVRMKQISSNYRIEPLGQTTKLGLTT